MIPELFKDSEWKDLLALADPALNAFGEKGAAIRRSVNWIIFTMYADVRQRESVPGAKTSFAAYASAGEQFLHGLRALDWFIAETEMFLAHLDTRPAKDPKSFFDEILAKRIAELCALFRQLDGILEPTLSVDIKTGPNSKPWLHTAVHLLYDLWRDELGQGERPKKDFLTFAFAVLGPTRLGITENSVLESFDRHVKDRQHLRHRMRQTRSI